MKINLKFNNIVVAILVIILTVIGIFADNPNTESKFNGWNVVGPTGGDIRAIAIDPRDKNRLFITTLDSQVYGSTDAGKTWRLLASFKVPQITLDDIVVDVEDSNIIYVTGHRLKSPGGFFYSRDGGVTWNEAQDLKNEAVHGFTQSAKNPNFLVAGSAGRVFFSYNRGADWKKVTDDKIAFKDLLVDSAAVDPKNTDIVYVGTTWRAYKTTDAGKTWKLISKGMIDDSDVFAIDIDPRNPESIIASACSGIYKSDNSGELWSKIQGIPSQSRRTKAILRNPARNGAIYAGTTEGFWMSADEGKTWALTSQRELEVNGIAVHPDEPNKIYIATNNYGIMISTDGGKNFSISNGNFTSRFMHQIVADIENPNRFYATSNNTATGGGFVFVSDNGGQTWKPSTKNLSVNRVSPHAILQDKTAPNTLYLGTNMGVFRSIDRGASWEQLKSAKPVTAKKTVAKKTKIKPAVVTTSAAVKKVSSLSEKVNSLYYSNDGKNGIYAATNKGLYRTYNINAGWEKLPIPADIDEQLFVVHTTEAQPNTVWVGTSRSGLIVSRDGGMKWEKMTGVPENSTINAIEINPTNPDIVYVGTSVTFYMTRDGGQNWVRRGGNLPQGNYNSILINPNNPNEIIVGSAMEGTGGIYQTLDGGQMWRQLDGKDLKLASRRVWTMAFDPKNPNRILVGTHSAGVFQIEREATANTGDTSSRPRVASNPN